MAITLEVIASSLADIAAAEAGGADRIELCQALSEGALTPSLGFMHAARRATQLPLVAMIRPRGGDDLFTDAEIVLMEDDIRHAVAAGMDGVIFCPLGPDLEVNLSAFRRLALAAGHLEVVCARTVDRTPDLGTSVERLCNIPGLRRVLTAGGPLETEAHLNELRHLVKRMADRVQIMTGVGLNPENVGRVARATGVSHFHIGWGGRTPKTMYGAIDAGKVALCKRELLRIDHSNPLNQDRHYST